MDKWEFSAAEPLTTINHFDDNFYRKVFLVEMLSKKEKKKFIKLLRQNMDFFAWKHSDVKGIHPSVACHHLNVK